MTCVMSTLEEISLQPVDSKDVVDGLTARAELLEEDDATQNAQGTLSSSEAGTTKQWDYKLVACSLHYSGSLARQFLSECWNLYDSTFLSYCGQ